MKWAAWKQTMDLKFEEVELGLPPFPRVLFQKWYREQNMYGSPSMRPKRQVQWRPVPGQPFITDILPGESDE